MEYMNRPKSKGFVIWIFILYFILVFGDEASIKDQVITRSQYVEELEGEINCITISTTDSFSKPSTNTSVDYIIGCNYRGKIQGKEESSKVKIPESKNNHGKIQSIVIFGFKIADDHENEELVWNTTISVSHFMNENEIIKSEILFKQEKREEDNKIIIEAFSKSSSVQIYQPNGQMKEISIKVGSIGSYLLLLNKKTGMVEDFSQVTQPCIENKLYCSSQRGNTEFSLFNDHLIATSSVFDTSTQLQRTNIVFYHILPYFPSSIVNIGFDSSIFSFLFSFFFYFYFAYFFFPVSLLNRYENFESSTNMGNIGE